MSNPKEDPAYECPHCGSLRSYSNGLSKEKRARRQCRDCKRYWTLDQAPPRIAEHTWEMIWRMIEHEGVSIRGASRVTGVSDSQIRLRNKARLSQVSMEIENAELTDGQKKSLILQMDEMHSFVQSKAVVVWIWTALEVESRRIIAVHFGGREEADAEAFISKIPASYLKHATIDTDGLRSYEKPLFERKCEHQRWPGKGHGMTNYQERFYGTVRRKLARLTRKSYCFSKCLWHHKRTFMSMIHSYNQHDAPRIVSEHEKRRRWRLNGLVRKLSMA